MQNYDDTENVYESDGLEDDIEPKFSYEVTSLPVENMVSFSNHPFRVKDDDALRLLTEDIEANGLINPIVVRKKVMSANYEVLSGHRRLTAVKKLGWTKIDAHIVIANDCQAANIVIRSNFSQRDKILPSEKARAYHLRNETLKEEKIGDFSHGGKMDDAYSFETLGKEFNESKTSMFRYMRLNFLIEDLLLLVDESKINLTVAENLSYFSENSQNVIYKYFFVDKKAKLDLKLVQQLRKLGQELTVEILDGLRAENSKPKRTEYEIIYDDYVRVCGSREKATQKINEILRNNLRRLERELQNNGDTKNNGRQENSGTNKGDNPKRENGQYNNRQQNNQHKNKKNHNNSGDTKPQS